MAANIRTLWNVLSVFLITAIVVLFRSIFVFREEADRIGIKYNSFEDIYQMLYALFIIISVRMVATALLKPTFIKRLKEVDQVNFELKKDKVCKEFLSMLWYIFAVAYGNIALFNHPYIPSVLNGGGSCDGLIRDYGMFRGDEIIRKYYIVQSAHHLYSLADHVFIAKKREDFSEMALHHICARAAIFFSYYTNQLALGATILLIHDFGDVFLNMAKITRDMKLFSKVPWILDIIVVLLFITWFFPRVVLINTCVLPPGIYTRHFDPTLLNAQTEELGRKMLFVDSLQIFLVFVIMLLNLWWSGVILMTGYRKFSSKKGESYVISTQGEKAKL